MNGSDKPEDIAREAAIAALPMTTAFDLDALPLSFLDGILAVGMTNRDNEALERIKFDARVPEVDVEIMEIDDIRAGLAKAYPKQNQDSRDMDDVRVILQNIINEAARRHAQDIFIEPASQQTKNGQVRYAIDGRLQWSERYRRLSPDIFARLIGYIYNQSDVQPQNSNVPGDGRLTLSSEGRDIDLRVAYIPMGGLSSINMRMLGSLLVLRNLQDLGMNKASYKMFSGAMKRPGAFITIAGPVGEGKSTTAYSAIKELDLDGQNICSIENPIECLIDGIKQISISAESGRSSKDGQMTFADAARALMRQYPQFVFLGEIRDKETLDIASLMSTTGISLICTTHAHNAIKTILRFEALGATRQQITQAMTTAMSQRLLGKLCPNCKVKSNSIGSKTNKLASLFGIDLEKGELYKAKPDGCERCLGRGYYDRIGAFEILEFTPEIIEALVAGESLTEIGHIAVAGGFRPMAVNAIEHMFNGDTDEHEIKRKVDIDEAIAYVRSGSTAPNKSKGNDDNPHLRAI